MKLSRKLLQQSCELLNEVNQKLRVVSYNILSHILINNYYYKNSKILSEYLEINYRYYLIQKKLTHEIQMKSIICLQEVSKGFILFSCFLLFSFS